MGKKVKRCPKKCQNHKFLLKPVHYSAVFSRELQASFCPSCLDDPSNIPTFNKDKRHFTTCFFLPVDRVSIDLKQERLQLNAEFYRNEHQKYKLENINEKSEMLIPKPKSKYSYCSVCKVDYNDYLVHIKSETHKLKIKDSKFDGYINQMCERLKEQTCSDVGESEEFKFMDQLQNKPSIFSQQTNILDLTCSQKLLPSTSQPSEYRQISNWLHSYKTFQLIPEGNDQIPMPQEEHDGMPIQAPFSPFKRYSEPTDGMRQVSNLRPIILFGAVHGECNC